MASEGQLVRMQNGRWARYQRLAVTTPVQAWQESGILVAVELDDHHQELLSAAEVAFKRSPVLGNDASLPMH